MNENTFPTETIDLPSKGLIYPTNHILKTGIAEMKYMGSKEEDILSNKNFIEKGIALDKLLESMTMKKFNVKQIHPGDKNALYIAIHILGYGKNYSFKYKGEDYTIDLTTIKNKPFNSSILDSNGHGIYQLPNTDNKVTFKFLTDEELDAIDEELLGLKKLGIEETPISTKLKHTITSINGDYDKTNIKNFIDNHLLTPDSRALRKFIAENEPDVDLTFKTKSGEEVALPIGLAFFWPDI